MPGHRMVWVCECLLTLFAAQMGLDMTCVTLGPDALDRKKYGTAYNLLQLDSGAYMVVLEANVLHPDTGDIYGTLVA